jgi:hypothetical protein
VRCENVEELYFHLHDLPVIPSFNQFLKLMWTTLGPTLRRFSINATWARLPTLLDPIVSSPLVTLEELSIRLVASGSSRSLSRRRVLICILAFVTTHRASLEALSLSSFEQLDVASLFRGFGHFPRLTKITISITMNRVTLANPSALSQFLNSHKNTLRELDIRPENGLVISNNSSDVYKTWISEELPKLSLDSLQSLKINLWPTFKPGTCPPAGFIPISPGLTSLEVEGSVVNRDDIDVLIKSLRRHSTTISLQKLRLSITRLEPELVDLLAAALPQLEEISLSVPFDSLSLGVRFFPFFSCRIAYLSYRTNSSRR